MSYAYQMNAGQYVLCENGQPIGPLLETVAIAFDKQSGTRHKHGNPEFVRKWLTNAQEKFRAGGFDEMANDLVMIEGQFPVEEINRCLDISGYVGRFYQKLMAGQVSREPSIYGGQPGNKLPE